MKAGLKVGQTAEIEITVEQEMRAQFEGQTVHLLFSTSSLVHQMEWVARKTILPYLETHEEGMGAQVDVSHLMLTPVGMKVKLRATVSEIRDRKIVCEVEAYNVRGKIARGTITQVIVEKSWLINKMKELTVIEHIAKDAEHPLFRPQGATNG